MATLSKLARIGVSEVREIGPARERALGEAGIRSVSDLLHHVPRRYLDRSVTTPIAELTVGGVVTVAGEITSLNTRRPRRNLLIVEAVIDDGSGNIKAVWFNLKHLPRMLREGMQIAVSGEVESYRGRLQMSTPLFDVLTDTSEPLVTGRVVPIHSQVAKISPWVLRRSIQNALTRSRPIPDPIPGVLLAEHGLMGRDRAFSDIHFPESMDQVRAARDRLAFDEFLRLELALALQKRRQMDQASGIAHQATGELAGRFIDGLPYRLTGAQDRVLGEIVGDLRAVHPMHRLLQGEVGSGKTVVAVATVLYGVEGGWQGAIMAPTEVLAVQHFLGVVDLLAEAGLSPEPFGTGHQLGMESLFASDDPAVRVGILTGSTAAANYRLDITRQALLEDIGAGRVDIVIGTHALIQEGVSFSRLGVVVVDEQHRFGVAQRVLLREKAGEGDPDVLIMTATPIPRTLSMTLYGDLDVSVIDEMPPGRTAVETVLLSPSDESLAWKRVEEEIVAGHQAFVVCPLVDDSPKVEAASATAESERLAGLLPGMRIGLIHGQLRPADKETVMASFRRGEIDVLVSTTVIEVGIDVPNATAMVIEDADRFGLSQLHQLRGRVGRGRDRGVCILLAEPTTDDGEERLAAMVSTNDGFRLAEEDLRIRGHGTVLGARQSGAADLRVADIFRDIDLLVAARKEAFEIVGSDPGLSHHPDLADEVRAMLGDSVDWLFKS